VGEALDRGASSVSSAVQSNVRLPVDLTLRAAHSRVSAGAEDLGEQLVVGHYINQNLACLRRQ
jgi:hypothetical protein